jgi:hypothetical protein
MGPFNHELGPIHSCRAQSLYCATFGVKLPIDGFVLAALREWRNKAIAPYALMRSSSQGAGTNPAKAMRTPYVVETATSR